MGHLEGAMRLFPLSALLACGLREAPDQADSDGTDTDPGSQQVDTDPDDSGPPAETADSDADTDTDTETDGHSDPGGDSGAETDPGQDTDPPDTVALEVDGVTFGVTPTFVTLTAGQLDVYADGVRSTDAASFSLLLRLVPVADGTCAAAQAEVMLGNVVSGARSQASDKAGSCEVTVDPGAPTGRVRAVWTGMLWAPMVPQVPFTATVDVEPVVVTP